MGFTRLLIVDDESYIRHGIRYAIPWHEHSIEVIGEAASGKEALEFCRHNAPDIVLTDIKMPHINGLELAKILSEQMPRIKIIILTAYSEPDYFCEAIENRVNSFVMKNANSDQILTAVLKAQKQFLAERQEQEATRRLQNIYNEHQKYLIELAFWQFLSGEIRYGQFTAKMRDLDVPLGDGPYALIAAELTTRLPGTLPTTLPGTLTARLPSTLPATLPATLPGTLTARLPSTLPPTLPGTLPATLAIQLHHLLTPYEPLIIAIPDHYLLLLLRTASLALTDRALTAIADLLGEHVLGNHIVYQDPIPHIETLPQTCHRLPDAMRMCFWDGSVAFHAIASDQPLNAPNELPNTPDFQRLEESEKRTLATIINEDMGAAIAAVRQHYRLLEAMRVPRDFFLGTMGRIFITTAAQRPNPPAIGSMPERLAENRHPAKTLALYEQLFSAPAKDDSVNRLLSRALAYIDENYALEIRLADIAGLVYLSEGYLSRIFKNETGYSFKEYLNKTRIEKAKLLVSGSDLKYYEVAEQVGYSNYKYFAQYFHKFCGCSAKEYRIRHGKA